MRYTYYVDLSERIASSVKAMNKSTFTCILITCLVFVNFYVYSHIFIHSLPEPDYPMPTPTETDEPIEDEPINALPENIQTLSAMLDDTVSGPLVLVNITHPYTFDATPTLFSFGENVSVYGAKSGSYSVRDTNVALNSEVVTALNTMLDDFSAYQNGKRSLIVLEGLRTYDEQLEILNEKIAKLGENQTIAQKPGYSEHHTGLAMDIDLYIDGIVSTFTGEGEYAWVFENAHKYGFILRYPADKESITGISYESWHFRYVGIPHAEYMYKNGLTLEEYIDTLALYPFESAHLTVTSETDGATYEVYSVAVPLDGTPVPVPTDKSYTLSGDNNGHVIVTVRQ